MDSFTDRRAALSLRSRRRRQGPCAAVAELVITHGSVAEEPQGWVGVQAARVIRDTQAVSIASCRINYCGELHRMTRYAQGL